MRCNCKASSWMYLGLKTKQKFPNRIPFSHIVFVTGQFHTRAPSVVLLSAAHWEEPPGPLGGASRTDDVTTFREYAFQKSSKNHDDNRVSFSVSQTTRFSKVRMSWKCAKLHARLQIGSKTDVNKWRFWLMETSRDEYDYVEDSLIQGKTRHAWYFHSLMLNVCATSE